MRRTLVPLATAVALAAAMLWLASGPFDTPPPPPGPAPIELTEPRGPVPAFPTRFAWKPVPGADLYEITVTHEDTATPLFRQRGPVAGLDLTIDGGSEPPPGRYAWEVLAAREGVLLARGTAHFHVRSGAEIVPDGRKVP